MEHMIASSARGFHFEGDGVISAAVKMSYATVDPH